MNFHPQNDENDQSEDLSELNTDIATANGKAH
jgi:hypothetical protein